MLIMVILGCWIQIKCLPGWNLSFWPTVGSCICPKYQAMYKLLYFSRWASRQSAVLSHSKITYIRTSQILVWFRYNLRNYNCGTSLAYRKKISWSISLRVVLIGLIGSSGGMIFPLTLYRSIFFTSHEDVRRETQNIYYYPYYPFYHPTAKSCYKRSPNTF